MIDEILFSDNCFCHAKVKDFSHSDKSQSKIMSYSFYPALIFRTFADAINRNGQIPCCITKKCCNRITPKHYIVNILNTHIAKYLKTLLYLLPYIYCAATGNISAQSVDTTAVTVLDEVTVTERYDNKETRATAPLQIIHRKDLKGLNVLQVSDAVKHFSGVTVKDYGGIGGLKTISVRSLGAGHTAVSIDGIGMSDAQNGQIDIGRFSLDNVDMLSLTNGQSDRIFQSARQFASAAVLDIKTLSPQFDIRKIKGKVAMKGGSWGLVNPTVYIAGRISDKLSVTASGEWMSANGRYPYILHYGTAAGDSTSLERRENTDVKNLRAEAALFGSDSVQSGNIKAYYFQSERGLPGATIFYNTANFSSQRIWDRTAFVQGHYERHWNTAVSLLINAKYNYSFTHYLDPVYLGSSGRDENKYHQHEYYVSAGVMYRPISSLSFNLSTDGIINTLYSDLPDFAFPTRSQLLTAVTGKYVNQWMTATASVLLTSVWETVRHGNSAQNRFKTSPYVSVSFKPFSKADFRLRVFYKNIFRLPTFNDLYYGRVGNINLLPETTDQINIGCTYRVNICRVIPLLSLTCDVYHNNVRNKIVAYPTKNIYSWTMLNYGKVRITGLDFSGETEISATYWLKFSFGATYTYNRALNITNPSDRDYGHQIPYTPRISGSGRAGIETPWINLNYSLVWSGHRYAVNQNYTENRVEGFFDHSLSASHDFQLPHNHTIGISIECLNLTDVNYEVVRYFPMPGRSWRATIDWRF